MQSITVSSHPSVQYLLRIGDTCLILAQRLAEWCGHAPVLEEDIALANMALDLVGQARAVLTRAGAARRRLGGAPRRGPARLPARRARLPQLHAGRAAARRLRGARCCATARVAIFLELLWQRLEARATASSRRSPARPSRKRATTASTPPTGSSASATAPTNRRRACTRRSTLLWPYFAELFEADEVDEPRPTRRPRPALGRRCATPGAPASPPCSRPQAWRCRPSARSAAPASAAATASTWATCWPRCSTCSARFRAACGDDRRCVRHAAAGTAAARRRQLARRARLGGAGDRARPRGAGRLGRRPRHRARRSIDDGVRSTSSLTPTYSGCPATEVIEAERRRRARRRRPRPDPRSDAARAGLDHRLDQRRRRRKLRGYGIAPPGPVDLAEGVPLRFVPRAVAPLACPRCDSKDTERLSAFGSTACKALYRCRACGEPFEHFKPI